MSRSLVKAWGCQESFENFEKGGILVAIPPVARIPHRQVYFEAIVIKIEE